MRTLIVLAGVAVTLTSISTFANDRLDFRTVNPAIQSIVDTVIAADENLDWTYPKFDPAYSSIEKERVKYDLTARLKTVPWSEAGDARVVGSQSSKADHTAGHEGIVTTAQATVKTDVLSLIRYSARIALGKRQEVNPNFDARIDAHLERLSTTRSLDEVYELLQSGRVLALDMIDAQAAHDQKWLEMAQAGQGDPFQAEQALKNDARVRKQIEGIKASAVRMNGHVQKINLSTDGLSRFFFTPRPSRWYPLQVHTTTLGMSETAIVSTASAYYMMTPSELSSFETDFQTKLLGVQQSDSDSTEYVQNQIFRQALICFHKGLRGDFVAQ
jgi:hypothetical protein